MTSAAFRSFAVGCAMLAAAGLAIAMKPKPLPPERIASFQLEVLVPKSFGTWHVDERIVPLLPSPDQKAVIDAIYDQTLARTYVNDHGERMMLSIAYGGRQSKTLQVHNPEACYRAQGFKVENETKGELKTRFGTVPVKRMMTSRGDRIEPVTYWITVGDSATHDGLSQRIQQLKYGLTGVLPDGMLVRVSSISSDGPGAFASQREFVEQLLASLSQQGRTRLAGTLGD